MTNYQAVLQPIVMACSVLSIPAHAQVQAESLLDSRSLVGSTDAAARKALQSKGWMLIRHARTGARSWGDWVQAGSSRGVGVEQIDGKVVSTTGDLLPAASLEVRQAKER